MQKNRCHRILQNTTKNNTKFLTVEASQRIEVYNSKNRRVLSIIRLYDESD